MVHGCSFRVMEGGRFFLLAGGFFLITLGLAIVQTSWAQQPAEVKQTTIPPSELDQPIRLLNEARRAFEGVKDYSCLLVKRERVDNQVGPDQVIQMKCRKEPFSIALNWQAPANLAGQEAYYIMGRNENQLRVKGAGGLGLLGYVTLAPNDPRVRAASNHSITEAGIGNLLVRFARSWERERQLGQTKVAIAEFEYNNRRCWRVETIHPLEAKADFFHYRNVLYFDMEHKLPLRLECYDWPTSPGDVTGPVAEIVSFAHLKLNVGLTDDHFVR